MPAARAVRLAAAAIAAALSGCGGSSGVVLQGYLFRTLSPSSLDEPVSGAEMTAFLDVAPDDLWYGGEQAPAGAGTYAIGFFDAGAAIHLVFEPSGEDLLPTVIPAVVPATSIEVDDGVFHVWPREAAATALGGEEALPDEGSGALIGFLGLAPERTGEAVLLATEGGDAQPIYLDGSGAADPSLQGTGDGGGFAFADLPPGPATLHTARADLAVWVLPGAVTSIRADVPD